MNSRSVLPVVSLRQHLPHLTDVAAIAITAIQATMISAMAAPRVILAFSLNVYGRCISPPDAGRTASAL